MILNIIAYIFIILIIVLVGSFFLLAFTPQGQNIMKTTGKKVVVEYLPKILNFFTPANNGNIRNR